MKITLAFIAIALFNTALFAQNDTTSNTQNVIVEIHDVVAVYREFNDARGRTKQVSSEIKGKIITYDANSGVLTFKGIDGKMYSFSSDQYEYFEYDKEFTSKKKKQKVLNPRKDSGFEISAGLTAGFLIIPTGFQTNEDYVGGITGGAEVPVCIKGGVSKYLNKNNLVGLTAEYCFLNTRSTYFNAGARYQVLYNPNKNATFYFPLELKFSHYKTVHSYQYYDTVYTDMDAEITINALELNFGQGVSFALKNKRSLSLELMYLKQFFLSEKIEIASNVLPDTDYRITGVKLSIFMNF